MYNTAEILLYCAAAFLAGLYLGMILVAFLVRRFMRDTPQHLIHRHIYSGSVDVNYHGLQGNEDDGEDWKRG